MCLPKPPPPPPPNNRSHSVLAIEACGFTLDDAPFRKADPRGIEYGQFIASLTPELEVVVRRYEGPSETSQPLYTMHFTTVADFAAWAWTLI